MIVQVEGIKATTEQLIKFSERIERIRREVINNMLKMRKKREPKFEISQSRKDEKYYFVLKAGNGKIICQSEGYNSEQMCEHGIESVKSNAPIAKIIYTK